MNGSEKVAALAGLAAAAVLLRRARVKRSARPLRRVLSWVELQQQQDAEEAHDKHRDPLEDAEDHGEPPPMVKDRAHSYLGADQSDGKDYSQNEKEGDKEDSAKEQDATRRKGRRHSDFAVASIIS